MRFEAMLINVLFLSLWVAVISVVADIQLHPIRTEDLQNIVDSVKKDVDRHLRATSNKRPEGPVVLEEVEKSTKVEDIDSLIKTIQDSMHEHLLKNLKPNVKDSGSTERTFPESGSSPVKSDVNIFEPSSETYEIRVGSSKGIPGVHFPDYTDIPVTRFTCSDKTNFPGFYADLDTGCQVFHVCYPNRRESFLCPMGTIFNQALRACDYWYNSNCSLATYYYTVNAEAEPDSSKSNDENISSMVNTLLEKSDSSTTQKSSDSATIGATADVLSFVSQFIPVKAKIVIYPETSSQRSKIVASASVGKNTIKNLKSRQRNLSSKRLRVPRSTDNVDNLETDFNIGALKRKIRSFRLVDGVKNAAIDIKNDKGLSYLSSYIDNILNYFTTKFFKDASTMPDVEPGSELYEYDIMAKERIQKSHEMIKDTLIFIAKFMYRYQTGQSWLFPGIWEDEDKEALEDAPLTNLNPRFMVKPATEQIRVKRSDALLIPLQVPHEDRMSIYPGTKKALLKNYVKLFKMKHG